MLTERGITHNVLKRRQHEQEAQIVADAGQIRRGGPLHNMAGAAPTFSWAQRFRA